MPADIAPLNEIADRVTRELVTSQTSGGAIFIQMPLLYPSGSTVVVRIDRAPRFTIDPEQFWVSDLGVGYEEAEMLGVSSVFVRHGKDIADVSGVEFIDHAFVARRVSRDQLSGAVIAIASSSAETAMIAAQRADESQEEADSDILFRRLANVFSPQRVSKDAIVVGASNTKWKVGSLVRSDDSETIFEAVSHHHSSIYAATTKFHDIGNVEFPPARVAVVRRKKEFKTFLAVLSQAARVIERDVPNETLTKLVYRQLSAPSTSD